MMFPFWRHGVAFRWPTVAEIAMALSTQTLSQRVFSFDKWGPQRRYVRKFMTFRDGLDPFHRPSLAWVMRRLPLDRGLKKSFERG
ncbi:hypothetical protein AGR8A_pTi20020 [Agrobacterium fabrum str. J-07]|nr:hypothetical protein AGR8A_pTi20020 [Agrobacterium fabrum str. J-07]